MANCAVITPVSYTHLDVYKRQAYTYRLREAQSFLVPDEIKQRMLEKTVRFVQEIAGNTLKCAKPVLKNSLL